MSKVDALRAMREARFAAYEAQAAAARRGGAGRTATPAQAPAPEPRPAKAAKAAKQPAGDAETDRVCGHRSIGNKSCQRPAGHAEKNHRYK
jgi:hypothetical protein